LLELAKAKGLGNQFLSHIRNCNAICQVVRAFENTEVLRSDSSRDPKHDIEIINTELVLADLQTAEKRLPRLEKEAKANPKLKPVHGLMNNIVVHLNNGLPLWKSQDLLEQYNEHLSDLQLMTAKPILYLFNLDETLCKVSPCKRNLESLWRLPRLFSLVQN
jgi:ribosome-binding ATPase